MTEFILKDPPKWKSCFWCFNMFLGHFFVFVFFDEWGHAHTCTHTHTLPVWRKAGVTWWAGVEHFGCGCRTAPGSWGTAGLPPQEESPWWGSRPNTASPDWRAKDRTQMKDSCDRKTLFKHGRWCRPWVTSQFSHNLRKNNSFHYYCRPTYMKE